MAIMNAEHLQANEKLPQLNSLFKIVIIIFLKAYLKAFKNYLIIFQKVNENIPDKPIQSESLCFSILIEKNSKCLNF